MAILPGEGESQYIAIFPGEREFHYMAIFPWGKTGYGGKMAL
jgi:hypothetical protein